jgi:hypothetical protein
MTSLSLSYISSAVIMGATITAKACNSDVPQTSSEQAFKSFSAPYNSEDEVDTFA